MPSYTLLSESAVIVTLTCSVFTVASAVFVMLPILAVTVFVKLFAVTSATLITYVAVVSMVAPPSTFSNVLCARVTPSISLSVIVCASS